MPSYKLRLKPIYKVKNWSEYNKILQKPGELSLYFPGGDIKECFINEKPYIFGFSGRQSTYKQFYIQLIFVLSSV